MSIIPKKFFVIANKIIGPKLFKTQQTVTKYQNLYPENLTIEQFDSEAQALSHLQFLKKEHERINGLDKVINKKKKTEEQQQKLEVLSETSNENKTVENSPKNEEEIKSEFNFFYFFKENEVMFKNAQSKIDNTKLYHMFFDGASRYNPGPSGCGYALYNDDSEKIYTNSLHLGVKTNNQAEYFGLIYGFRSALNLGIKKLHCYGDSELVIKQMNGNYQVKSKSIVHHYTNAIKLKKEFYSVKLTSIAREENGVANKLAVDGKFGKKIY